MQPPPAEQRKERLRLAEMPPEQRQPVVTRSKFAARVAERLASTARRARRATVDPVDARQHGVSVVDPPPPDYDAVFS